MEQKITKIFSYFTDIKHQNIFSLCVLQLVEAYEDSPQALKPILYNLKTLFFSNTKESRLKLKQRQLAASIIQKILARHTTYLDNFLKRDNIQDMEHFHIQDGSQQFTTQLETYSNKTWDSIPFAKLIEDRPLLFKSQEKFKQTEQELKRIEAQFFDKLNDTKTANASNLKIFLGDLVDLHQGDTNLDQQQVRKPTKYQKKIEKLKKKTESQPNIKSQGITVFNAFNFIYEFGIENIMSPNWQTRHLSILLLKSLTPYLKYIGFSFYFKADNGLNKQTFQIVYHQCQKELENFIKQKVFVTLKRQIIFQNILLLSLDRFADYQAERSNIMVRSVGAKILTMIYQQMKLQQKQQFLQAVKTLLQIQPANDSVSPFAWQLRHSFVYLIYCIIQNPKNKIQIFQIFKSTFVLLLRNINQEQVILTLCQCLSLLSTESFFTTQYAKQINNMLWEIIANLDDVSYSATKIFSLLMGYLHLVQIDELDCLFRLKNFFTNRIEEVRKQFYNLETFIFERKFKISTKQNYRQANSAPSFNNIIPWTSLQFFQQIMVEQYEQNLNSLVKLGASLFTYLLSDGQDSMIPEFCSDVVCVYKPIQIIIDSQFVNKNNYRFICQDEKNDILNDHINIRIWKISRVIGQMLVHKQNHLTESVLEPFISLGTDIDTRFLLITLGIISSAFCKKPQYADDCMFLIPFVEKVLKIEASQITTQVINLYQKQFQNKLTQYTTTLTDPQQQQLCTMNIDSKSWDLRSKLHSKLLLKYGVTPSNQLHIIISLIQTIVEIQKDLLKHLKILASYCYCSLIPNQQPKPLNLIIKSIQQNLKEERYHFITNISSSCMLKLSNILLQKNKSVYVKFTTNTLNQIASKYQLKVTNISRKKEHFLIDSTRMQGIGKFIQNVQSINPLWLNQFQQPFIKGFIQQQHNKSSLNLLQGTIESIITICDKNFLQKLLGHLQSQLAKNNKENEGILYNIIKKMLGKLSLDWKQQSNIFLEWFYKQMGTSLAIVKILQRSLEENIKKLSSICCIFLLEGIRLMTGGGQFREPAMGCLSNLFMGAFISTHHPKFSPFLQSIAQKGVTFVKDFKNISNFDYKIQIKMSLDLRSYQVQGIKWLGFLTKYYLNGALCDDMGLGKTLQTLTMIENQYFKMKKQSQQINSNKEITLIVAPATLIQHWKYQYKKYFSQGNMHPYCVFEKNDPVLNSLGSKSSKYNLIITSYAVVQKCVHLLEKIKYQFIILDQGHLVKNSKTNKFKALARLQSSHKFILSGTPVQNKLLQLWGIFEFLMPGYLGSQQEFKSKYNKLFNVNLMTFKEDDLLFSKEQKDVLEALHVKVMPFILRRLKKEVLKQLPDKIIQDYLCKMTDVQKQLYSAFDKQRTQQKFDVNDYGKEESSALAILNQMRKIVNHPNLVGKQLTYAASGKFLALKDLFDDMNFETPSSITHKIIIFSRFNATLDLIQSLLLDKVYPQVKYSKLTGSTAQNKRFDVAQQFNDSFDIKVLLTTTSIGGYGLNLTSANIVIMFDHDYNPSVDMQAIDRAHRLGQKNVLNVYRLVMKDTLQQKIMGIQRFKNNLANAIVNLDNASIKNVEDSKLPDLLQKITVIQQTQKTKISKSLYAKMVQQMQKDAIEIQDYDVQY